MLNTKYTSANFGICLSNPCNNSYHKCKNTNITFEPVSYTEEQQIRYAEYIKHIIKNVKEQRLKCIHIHGETLLDSLNNIIPFVKELKDTIDIFILYIQEKLTQEKIKNIYSLWKILGEKLKVDVQYNFSLSEEDKSAYDSLYYNIRWIFSKKLGDTCFVGITPKNAHKITEIFNDFLTIRKEFPSLYCMLYLQCDCQYDKNFNKDIVESAIKTIYDYINNNPELGVYFTYSENTAFRNTIETSVMSNVLCEMTKDGNLYPGYNIRNFSDKAREELIFGNISEDFSVLDERKNQLLEKLKTIVVEPSEKEKIFKAVPWTDDNFIYNIEASEQVYTLHILLSTYLYEDMYKNLEQK